jgi:hypothetical protein
MDFNTSDIATNLAKYIHAEVDGDSNVCGRLHDLVDHYGISVSQMNTDRFHLSLALSGIFLVHDL